MKKLFIAVLLIIVAGATFAFSQTRKRVMRKRTTGKTGVTKIAPATVPKIFIPARASAAVTTDSGLTYLITRAGGGAQLKAGDTITVSYTGLLTDGVKFDSSHDRSEPYTFLLGAGQVIKGWDEGFQKLHVGDQATFFIPPSLAYGTRGAGSAVPADATLIFVVEVLEVK